MAQTNSAATADAGRQYDLDRIKVYGMGIVFLYHCTMFFNPFAWHIKNNELDETWMTAFSLLVGNWMMPLFFVISGIGAFHALRKRSGGAFMKERALRLGLPLLLGVFVLSPPQVYVERVTNDQYDGTFAAFLPRYFDGLYLEIGGTGNFAFFGHHLWYLLMLLAFAAITLPPFLRVRERLASKPFGAKHALLLPLPAAAAAVVLNDVVNLAGWGIVFYLILYVYGFVFFARDAFRLYVRRIGAAAAVIAAVATAAYVGWFMAYGPPASGTLASLSFMLLRVALTWSCLLAIFYAGDRFLNRSSPTLRYASEASMPFYVLHQPVIIAIGCIICEREWPVWAKMVLLVSAAFLTVAAAVHYAIRKSNLLRVPFGLRAVRRARQEKRSVTV